MGVVRLVEDAAATIEFTPDVLPASATCTLYQPGGTSVTSPTVTVDATDTTINGAPTSQTVFTITSASGMVPARRYWWESVDSGGHGAPVLVSEIDGTTITLESPPPGTLKASDPIKGLRLTAPLTATHTADRGRNYRLDWAVTDAAGDVYYYRQVVDIVRTKFADPCTPDEVARYVAGLFPNWAGSTIDAGHYAEIARRASDRVLDELRTREFYPDLFGDQGAFKAAGRVAMRIELYHQGLVHPSEEPQGYFEAQESELDRQLDRAIAGCWYDRDDSGGFSEATETQRLHGVRLVRV